ncbi:MAG: hypothetical protein IJ180_10090 [Bacteroidales bacterium]|nr:hypothetical protein [Bacteroidales bacterium]
MQIAYNWEDFFKPKIVYPNMTQFFPFYYDAKGFITNQKCFIITGQYIEYLTAIFNSKLFQFCFSNNFPKLGDKGRELSKIFFDKISILQINDKQNKIFKQFVDDIQNSYTKEKYANINQAIYTIYNLTQDEIYYIENKIK